MNKPSTILAVANEKEKTSFARLMPYLWIFAQLVLAGILIFVFQIEADLGLVDFWPLLCLAFCIHASSSLKYRPVVFFGCFAAILIYFVGVLGAIKVLGTGMLLIGLCHLPFAYRIRQFLLFLCGLVLALMLTEVIPSVYSSYQMRIIATIFMFRVILYIHELKHEKTPATIWQRLNYFFFLPNIIFPLFPIVDYQHYKKRYFNVDATLIYQRGVDLILWSLLCLLIYRWIYLFGIPRNYTLVGLGDVLHYVIATYLTVIRLIGLLGLSVGMLRLFGYNLPDIFNYMFFASSFSDLYRRVNVYWKKFLMKVFYFPVYLKLRKWSPVYAIPIAVMITYLFTWFFHLYQWFWILGTNPLRDTSVIYWGIFGVVAVISTLIEENGERKKADNSIRYVLIHSLKVIITFLAMSFLYTLWVSSGIGKWFALVNIAINDSFYNWMKIIFSLAGVWMLSSALFYIYLNKKNRKTSILILPNFVFRSIGIVFFIIMITCTFLPQKENTQLSIFIENDRLNEKDDAKQYTGYYDEVLKHKDVASRLWGQGFNVVKKKDVFKELDIVRSVNNVMLHEFIPSSKGFYKNKLIETNRWGFRDKDYNLLPDSNTIRIALVGASPTMGSGVANDEVFEAVLEEKLNQDFGKDSLKIEILNFAFPSTCIYHHAFLLKEKIQDFQPDYIMNIEHCRPFVGFGRKIERGLKAKVPLYSALNALVLKENISLQNLKTDADKNEKGKIIAEWGYRYYKNLCDEMNIKPIWVFLPAVSKANFFDEYKRLAVKAGFKDIINMGDIYKNYNQKILQVGIEDRHPNAEAHQIIAKRFYRELVEYLNLEK